MNVTCIQFVPFLLLPIQVPIALKGIIAFNLFWSQIEGFRATIFMRKIQLYKQSSFATISIYSKLDFSGNLSICAFFTGKINLFFFPCFTIFIVAQKVTHGYR